MGVGQQLAGARPAVCNGNHVAALEAIGSQLQGLAASTGRAATRRGACMCVSVRECVCARLQPCGGTHTAVR